MRVQGLPAEQADTLTDTPECNQGGDEERGNGDVIAGVHGDPGQVNGGVGRGCDDGGQKAEKKGVEHGHKSFHGDSPLHGI